MPNEPQPDPPAPEPAKPPLEIIKKSPYRGNIEHR